MASTPQAKKRSGGPRTDAGKAAASRNAFKGGLTLNGLINDVERAEYAELLDQLRSEYAPKGVTMSLLLDGFAIAVIKRRRQDRVESAMYEKARITAAHFAERPGMNSFANCLPATPEGQARARQIVVNAAMPEMQRLDVVVRYGIALDRQFKRLLDQIQHQHEIDSERGEPSGPDPDEDPNSLEEQTLLQ